MFPVAFSELCFFVMFQIKVIDLSSDHYAYKLFVVWRKFRASRKRVE